MQPDDTTVRILLRARNGSVRAYALIDAADAEWVNQWRWAWNGKYAYRTGRLDGRKVTLWMHRELLGLTPGDGLEGDHIDRVKLNNRRSSLRAVPPRGNKQNTPSLPGSSAYRGVSWDKARSKWHARLEIDGKTVHLGRFATEIEAAEVARAGRIKLLPFSVD